jgi:hypothetical protein
LAGKSFDAGDEIDVDRTEYEDHVRLSDSNRISLDALARLGRKTGRPAA